MHNVAVPLLQEAFNINIVYYNGYLCRRPRTAGYMRWVPTI